MALFLQGLPLIALVAMLASGRVAAYAACAVAMVLSLPAALLQLSGVEALPGFALRAVLQGAWLGVVPLGFIIGGLVFHAAVSRPGGAAAAGGSAEAGDAEAGDAVDRAFTATFLLGPFAECATGFGVGTVFAIGVLRRVGIGGRFAALIGLVAQAFIPWGGLGPGTTVGAALAEVSGQALATRNAWMTACVLLLLLPAVWGWMARAGHRVGWRVRGAQAGWVAVLGGLLVLLHGVAPWEMCGLLATGTVLAGKLLWASPPRGAAGWRAAVAAAGPYLGLVGMLAGLRLWQTAPVLRPFAEMPGLALNHGVVAVWLVAGVLLARSAAPRALLVGVGRRGRRPVLTLIGFVMLARVLALAGIPQALAGALARAFGTAAPFAAPVLAAAAGFFGGTNVASNAAMMPLQAALGRLAGLDPVVLPAVQNGTPFLMISMQVTAIAVALAGGDATQGRVWRLGWPIALIGAGVGMASVLIG